MFSGTDEVNLHIKWRLILVSKLITEFAGEFNPSSQQKFPAYSTAFGANAVIKAEIRSEEFTVLCNYVLIIVVNDNV